MEGSFNFLCKNTACVLHETCNDSVDMKLDQFIEEIGDEAAAKLFDVKPRTVASWRRGERKPRPDKAIEIVKTLRGKIPLEGIYPKRK